MENVNNSLTVVAPQEGPSVSVGIERSLFPTIRTCWLQLDLASIMDIGQITYKWNGICQGTELFSKNSDWK